MESEGRDIQLIEAVLRKWLLSALASLTNETFQKKSFWFSQLQIESNTQVSISPQYFEVLGKLELDSTLFENNEFLEVKHQFSKDSLIKRHVHDEIECFHVKEKLDEFRLVEWFLKTYLTNNKYRIEFEEEVFRKAMRIFNNFFESNELHVRFWATAMNCISNQRIEVNLENPYGNLKIRKMDIEEIKSLLQSVEVILKSYQKPENEIPQFLNIMSNIVADLSVKQEKRFVSDKQESEGKAVSETYIEAVKCLELTESTLRLIYPQWLAFGPLFMWIDNAPFSEYSQLEFNRALTPRHDVLDVQSNFVTEGDSDIIKRKWQKVWSGTEESSLIDTALRRYTFSYDRKSLEDCLIDQMIAFEALFLADASDELSFRLATRVASLLGDSSSKKKELFDLMRDAYGLRSRIVHGGEYDDEKLSKMLPKTQSVLQSCFNKILDNDLIPKIKKSQYWDALLFN